jgi:hypothetical protein
VRFTGPVTNFHNGKTRRYECKEHSKNRERKPRSVSKKQKKSVAQKTVAQVWHAAYMDCKALFGQMTVGMSQKALHQLFQDDLGLSEPSKEIRLVPIDPCKQMEIGNSVRLVPRRRGSMH